MEDKTIGSLFGKIHRKKKEFDIQYYSITQTTLEQIFQKLANGGIDSDKSAITFTCDGE